VSSAIKTEPQHTCRYCEKTFRRPESLAVHVCEPKRRYQEQQEVGVQLGLQCYLKFYESTQGSAKLKTFDDFARSPYYRAFVKFGRYCVDIKAINVARFIDWLLKHNKKIDHWCRDSIYGEYITDYVRSESTADALARAIEEAMTWAEETGNPDRDYLRYGNTNRVCYAITTGKISPWVLYNCGSGMTLLENLSQEQIAMIWPMIDSDFWQRKFRDYRADAEYAREILTKAGW
jgi:hypothetical protein